MTSRLMSSQLIPYLAHLFSSAESSSADHCSFLLNDDVTADVIYKALQLISSSLHLQLAILLLLEWRLLIDSSTVLIIATANRFVNSNLRIFFFNRFLQRASQFQYQLVHLYSLALAAGCHRFSWFIMLQLIQLDLRLITNS
ncbi:hypothetical protein F511_04866 [Dorcoceras hygrometricum]|uniref:Uncharacterized protein n=1 Tax=Dorcoceras hygrometricum TaxID=472368 RepID=A0A2Z7DC45_9LAMI|nr:hypothetical protein F511_04866 [Dorcoceras hygrometricum]